jgi:hypothetical protein
MKENRRQAAVTKQLVELICLSTLYFVILTMASLRCDKRKIVVRTIVSQFEAENCGLFVCLFDFCQIC